MDTLYKDTPCKGHDQYKGQNTKHFISYKYNFIGPISPMNTISQ